MAAVASQTSILIVDDHRDTADMLRRFLARKNIPCEVVDSGPEALKLIGTRRPLCIILDEWMPDMTGLEFLKQLRGHPDFHDVPVVFYSAAFDMRKQTEAERLGAKGWFVKGVARLEDLAIKVVSLVSSDKELAVRQGKLTGFAPIISTMPMVSDRCICLRKVEYSESFQILTLFSRHHGLVRAIAKGAHRRTKQGASKFDGGADLLDRGDAVFTHDPNRDLETLTEWGLREGHLGLRKTLRGMYLALYAGELCSLLIEEHDPHPALFDLLEETLLDLESERREESFLTFQIELLRETGHLPELAACVSCGSDARSFVVRPSSLVYFSPSRGGLICPNCESAIPDRIQLDARLARLLLAISCLPEEGAARRRLPRLTREQTDPLNYILSQHTQHLLGRRLRLTAYILDAAVPMRAPVMAQ